MEVLCITATKNRHTHLEKLVQCFLNQDYEGKHTLLIYNNSDTPQSLWKELEKGNKQVILINNHINLKTYKPYTNLGSIYNDILFYVRQAIHDGRINPLIVNHMDDDDFFLPNHITEGVKGYKKGGLLAYKPSHSYYKSAEGTSLAANVLEPSIFVNYAYLATAGYWDRNVDLHHRWLQPLIEGSQISVQEDGQPTFIYDWSGEINTWKTSGDPHNPNNFSNYEKHSQDIGDGIITPTLLKIT